MRVVLSDAALSDVDDIAAYLDTISPRISTRVIGTILTRCRSLSSFSRRGKPIGTKDAPELRRVIAEQFVIIYEVEPAQVTILRVLHGARDLPAVLAQTAKTDPP